MRSTPKADKSGEFIIWTTVARGRYNNALNRRVTAVELYRAWLTGADLPPAARLTTCDRIEYEGGIAMSTGEAAQNIAAGLSMIASAKLTAAPPPALAMLAELRGHDLCCWCPLDQPCHADALLELANV